MSYYTHIITLSTTLKQASLLPAPTFVIILLTTGKCARIHGPPSFLSERLPVEIIPTIPVSGRQKQTAPEVSLTFLEDPASAVAVHGPAPTSLEALFRLAGSLPSPPPQ